MTEKEVAAIFDLLSKLPPLRGDHIMFPTGDPGLDALLPGEVPKGMVAVIKNGVLTYETFESFGGAKLAMSDKTGTCPTCKQEADLHPALFPEGLGFSHHFDTMTRHLCSCGSGKPCPGGVKNYSEKWCLCRMGGGKNPCEEIGPPTSYFETPDRAPSMGCPVDEPRYTGPHLDLTEHSKDLMGTPHLCPGCRSLDGEHNFGPSCTLEKEP